MKKLVCAKEVEALAKKGEKVLYVDADTLITPSARDAAKAAGITLQCGTAPACTAAPQTTDCCSQKPADGQIDPNLVYNVFKALADKGLLNGICDVAGSSQPYVCEKDPNGLKIVRGRTVNYEALDTGNPNDKVFYQEIINKDDGCSMNAGFITIENCKFDWECQCEELYHVVEGTLTVTVGDKVYTAQPGDSVFFPNGAKVAFGSPNKMKAFYATY